MSKSDPVRCSTWSYCAFCFLSRQGHLRCACSSGDLPVQFADGAAVVGMLLSYGPCWLWSVRMSCRPLCPAVARLDGTCLLHCGLVVAFLGLSWACATCCLPPLAVCPQFAVLYAKSGHVGRLEIGRTETVFDDLCPRWCHSFILDYERNNPKTLVLEVFDRDSRSERLRKHDHIGSVECSLEDVREAPGKRLKLRLRNQHIRSVVPGYVSLVAEKVNPCDPALTVAIHVEAALLKRKNTTVNVGVSQFFTIMRAREEANGTLSYSPVYRSEAVTRAAGDGAGYARFKTANLTVQKLTNGFFKRPLRIQFHRRKLNGDHKLLGYVDTSLTDLCAMDPHGESRCLLPLEGAYQDESSLGNVILVDSELTQTASAFHFRVDHFLSSKFCGLPPDVRLGETPYDVSTRVLHGHSSESCTTSETTRLTSVRMANSAASFGTGVRVSDAGTSVGSGSYATAQQPPSYGSHVPNPVRGMASAGTSFDASSYAAGAGYGGQPSSHPPSSSTSLPSGVYAGADAAGPAYGGGGGYASSAASNPSFSHDSSSFHSLHAAPPPMPPPAGPMRHSDQVGLAGGYGAPRHHGVNGPASVGQASLPVYATAGGGAPAYPASINSSPAATASFSRLSPAAAAARAAAIAAATNASFSSAGDGSAGMSSLSVSGIPRPYGAPPPGMASAGAVRGAYQWALFFFLALFSSICATTVYWHGVGGVVGTGAHGLCRWTS